MARGGRTAGGRRQLDVGPAWAHAQELRAEMTAGTAFKRNVTEADVVATTLFLCSSAADNLTGQDINVSAGAVMY